MSTVGHSRARAVAWGVAGVALLLFIIDAGSSAIARIQVDDDAKQAGRYAVQQISDDPVNQATAQKAYAAAVSALPNDQESIVTNGPGTAEDFRLGQDRSITMTVQRHAPTLVFKYIPGLKDFTTAKVTYTQQQLGM